MAAGELWSRTELEAVVGDYCDMLLEQERGQEVRKVDHYKPLIVKLGRTKPSIEMRYQNISAALIVLKAPWVSGYAPLSHGAKLVLPYVVRRFERDTALRDAIARSVAAPVPEDLVLHRDLKLVKAPVIDRHPADGHEDERTEDYGRRRRPPIDWLAREARNASVGRAGELLVMQFERRRLVRLRRRDLSRLVEHVGMDDEGAGFDILSFDEDGGKRYIEVKSTAYGRETPFFASLNEVEVSRDLAKQYHLYRVFKLRAEPSLFTVAGALNESFALTAEMFRARVA